MRDAVWHFVKLLAAPAVRHFAHQKAQIAELLHVLGHVEAQISLHAHNNRAEIHDLSTRLNALAHVHGQLATQLDVITRQNNDLDVKSDALAHRNDDLRTQLDILTRQIDDPEARRNENLRALLETVAHKVSDLSTTFHVVKIRNDELAAQSYGLSHQIHDLVIRWDAVAHRINQESDKSGMMWADSGARLDSLERLIKHIEATSVSRFDYLEADRNIFRQINGADANAIASRVRTIGKLLRPHMAVGRSKLRLGGPADGGYICLDDFGGIKTALSFGIDQDVSWDLAAANLGLVVHQFDHTVDGPPTEHPNFRFNKIKIASVDQPGEQSIGSILASRRLNEPGSVILKIDIEGGEWDVLSAATELELDTFSQIICEFHGFQFVEDHAFYEKVIKVLSKIESLFRVVHVHGNNYCPMFMLGGVPFPSLLEVTFVNGRRCEFTASKEIFPTPMDAPNKPTRPDFFLGDFLF